MVITLTLWLSRGFIGFAFPLRLVAMWCDLSQQFGYFMEGLTYPTVMLLIH